MTKKTVPYIAYKDFPLNFDRYNNMMDELRDAARGFARLEEKGWPGARDLDKRLMAIWSDLSRVWETIVETERHVLYGAPPETDGQRHHPEG